jgi:hypothetical protein
VAPLHAKASDTRPQPNFGITRDDKAEQTESGSAGKEHECPANEHGCRRARTVGSKARTAETLPMSRTTTTDAFEGLTTCVDLMVTLKAPKTSPSSPTLDACIFWACTLCQTSTLSHAPDGCSVLKRRCGRSLRATTTSLFREQCEWSTSSFLFVLLLCLGESGTLL